MKKVRMHITSCFLPARWAMLVLACVLAGNLSAQDTEAPQESAPVAKPVKNTFESIWIIDNQSVMVPIKGTFEMDIQHRFGTVKNGYKDLWGFYAPSNIRLGFNYAPVNKLNLGFGLTKERLQWDFNLKYALLQQMKGGGSPLSVSYFGNMVIDGREKKYFVKGADRLSFFHQLIIARKITEHFSAQVAPSISYRNNVEGYLDPEGAVQPKMKNEHFAVSVAGRYKLSEGFAITAGVDQPITQHPTNNPYPNICFGVEMTTSAHTFQVFATNYQGIVPQSNNIFNQNDFQNGAFLIGFNITRLWNF